MNEGSSTYLTCRNDLVSVLKTYLLACASKKYSQERDIPCVPTLLRNSSD